MVTYLKVSLKWNHRVNEQKVQGTRCRGLVPMAPTRIIMLITLTVVKN